MSIDKVLCFWVLNYFVFFSSNIQFICLVLYSCVNHLQKKTFCRKMLLNFLHNLLDMNLSSRFKHLSLQSRIQVRRQGFRGSLFYTIQIMPANSSTNLEETLRKISLKIERIHQNDIQQHSLEVFQRYFEKDTKAWFSPVRLNYSHSLLHNNISNRLGVNAHSLSHWK